MSFLTLFIATAAAAPMQVWSVEETAEGYLHGEDGWLSGYRGDRWYAFDSGEGFSWLTSMTDDTGDGTFGGGGAHDNWLVNEAVPVGDGLFTTDAYIDDNDAWGVMIGHAGAEDWLMVLFCGATSDEGAVRDCPTSELSAPAVAIVELSGGELTLLDAGPGAFEQGDYGTVEVSLNDGQVEVLWSGVHYDGERFDEVSLSGETTVSTTTSVGFYAYNQGYVDDDTDRDSTYFALPTLYQHDDDDDDIADDEDNCEFVSNEGQEDGDADGIGDACDEAPVDTGTTDTGETDTGGSGGNGGNGGGEGGGGGSGGLVAPGSCNCATPGASRGLAFGLLAAVVALARRRASAAG